MAEKVRLDNLIVQKGITESREKAKALIMAGQIYIDNQKCDKAGQMIDPEKVNVELRGETLKYVSRGGLKLEKAMKSFPILQEKWMLTSILICFRMEQKKCLRWMLGMVNLHGN